MLNCISGMVEKTQSAISILQQRQAEAGNVRTAEELVAEVQVMRIFLACPPSPAHRTAQAKANLAIHEVKQAALEELRQFRAVTAGEPGLAGLTVQNKNKEEVSSEYSTRLNSGRTVIKNKTERFKL